MARASKSGGWVWPLRLLILTGAVLITTAASSHPPYRRAEWPHWIDADGDCQDARAEILIRDAPAGTVTFRDERECAVDAGEWAYTGGILSQAGEVDVDHLIPLKNAHDSGGWRWSREQRREYANDLSYRYHLLAVSRAAAAAGILVPVRAGVGGREARVGAGEHSGRGAGPAGDAGDVLKEPVLERDEVDGQNLARASQAGAVAEARPLKVLAN